MAAFKTAMYGYSYYENILKVGGKLSDLDQKLTSLGNPVTPKSYSDYDNKFSGNFATPFAAFSHFMFGKGEDMNVSIQNLGLKVSASEVRSGGINQLDRYIGDKSLTGTKEITVSKFAYDTANDNFVTGAYLGNISLKLIGDFTREKDGSWEFDGRITAYSDVYDFNPSSHRNWVDEAFTYAGATIGGTNYDINITWGLAVHWSGNGELFN
ncbi:lipid II-degrading bacteriocin [Ciceribacter sp. L1K22]|uniref:lipid II-degrading bacteriocin n=1 Tax=Ciceribacter sp. L1K22 TaxID=2820275 RepID=UPI001ABE892D|nr:lipid II-degrading bacteriocin [Ciceribacter sp. L1K22]MBO3759591.1 lipid II-degrading bacteriocin [Ciceribacter sp. L1K22]